MWPATSIRTFSLRLSFLIVKGNGWRERGFTRAHCTVTGNARTVAAAWCQEWYHPEGEPDVPLGWLELQPPAQVRWHRCTNVH